MEGIGPKTGIKIAANQHGAKGIPNGLVGALYRAILVGTIGTCGADGVSMALKESANFLIVVKFASLVKIDILPPRNVWGVLFEPVVEPVEQSTAFGDAKSSI
jgi:hypothetical protein